MELRWTIASRTGEQYSGEDCFPTQEQKDNAATFELQLGADSEILAPYGQTIVGKSIKLAVPDGHSLVFKRRCRFVLALAVDGNARGPTAYRYVIAFETVGRNDG